MLTTVISNYREGIHPGINVRRHQADDALKEMEHFVFSNTQYQKDISEMVVKNQSLARLVNHLANIILETHSASDNDRYEAEQAIQKVLPLI